MYPLGDDVCGALADLGDWFGAEAHSNSQAA